MLIEILTGQLFLALFNVANAFGDAYLIFDNKKIAHAVNFGVYVIFTAVLCLILGFRLSEIGLFFLSAFFNRQLTFDIPLNLRRGKAWDYQSTDNPPKSLTDRIERAIFGTGENVGKLIANFYMGCYAAVIITFIVIFG